VTEDRGRRHETGSSPWADDSADDLLEQGGRPLPWLHWRLPRGAAILLAAGLIVGLAAGYATGYRQARPARPAPVSTAAPVRRATVATGPGTFYEDDPALSQAAGTCSAQSGRELQLGVQVTNDSIASVGLGRVRAVLPLGGLKAISQRWAPCGAIGTGQDPVSLAPGDSTWFSVTFRVLARCPGPDPVQFAVGYTTGRTSADVRLEGFPDLSRVRYSGCTSQKARGSG
jgi:hypothetical protein